MPENTFLTALQTITAGGVTLGDLLNMASGLTEAEQPALARQLYKVWIKFNPDHPQLYVANFNCSGLDTQLGDEAAAIEGLNAAIAQNPDFMPAYINLGGALDRTGRPDQAIETWKSALARSLPVTGEAVGYAITTLKQIVRVLSDNHRSAAAEIAVRQCLDLNPQQRDVVEQFIALRLAQCSWPVVAPWGQVDRKTLMNGIHPLSVGVYTDDPLLQLAAADRYVKSAVDHLVESEIDRRDAQIDLRNRRMRVGYVSSDLRDHAIGYLMAEVFELHHKSDVEVFAYYCGPPSTSPLNARIKSAVEHWTDIRGMSDDQAARQIAADGIDILVDVNGHTRDARLGVFARRPAPIQVNWLGFPGSMGSPFHQYIISDEWIIPPGSEFYYSERVARLPCYQSNDRKRIIAPERPTRAEVGLPEDAFVFCCFNGTHKVSRFTFMRWLEILKRVPGSVLWLLDNSVETNAHLGDMAEQNGVDRARLVFAPKIQNAMHLARYPLADLFLDTAPYGAHTTASDALWMAVPVLTLSGRSFPSRVCGSLVRAAGLPELVCDRPEDYVERAVALGNDRATVKAYKARLAAGRDTCLLFDTEKLVGALEALYQGMCAEHQRGATPRPDLAGLDAYLAVGIEHDHEAEEMLAVADYHGFYRTQLARKHLMRPVPPDSRLWTAEVIAAVEKPAFAPVELEPRRAAPRKRQAAA